LLVYGGVALLVLVALGLTAMRLALPFASDYRVEAERRVSDYLGQPVHINRLEARLEVLSPTLVLKDVQLFDKSGRRSIARFSEIRVGVALLDSLLAGAPVMERMEVVGSNLTVERLKDGSFRVRGLARDPDQSDPEAMGRWLLAQHRIILRDSHVEWRDAISGRTFTFNGAALELRNDGARHRLSGRVELPEGLGGRLKLAIDMEGDPLAAGGVRGSFYAGGEKMRPAGALRLYPVAGLAAGGGDISAEVWGRWERGRLLSLEGLVDGRELQVSARGHTETFSQLAGRFAWAGKPSGWRLDVDDLVLGRAGHLWKPARVRVDRAGEDESRRAYTIQASFLRVEDLAAIAGLVPVAGDWQQPLAEWDPRGDLSNVRIELAPGGQWRVGAAFTDLAGHATARHPGFAGLDGYASYGGGDLSIRLDTRDAQLELPGLFRAPLALAQATGEVRVGRDGKAWRVSSDGLAVANSDIRGRAAFTITLPERGAPFVDLVGDFGGGNAVTVPKYLPAKIMPTDAVTWLDAAFKGGRVIQGGLLLHGRVDQFPFDHGEGRFEVRFDADNVELDYMPPWPRLTGVAGEVVFDGRAMRIAARTGRLHGTNVSDTTVEIPDLENADLVVKGHVTGELNNLFDYLRVTDLAGHFSAALGQFTSGGPFILDLAFSQPLSDTTLPGKVQGKVAFEGSRLAVAHGVEFTDIRGHLWFNDDRYVSDAITARLFGAPARVRVDAAENGTATRIQFQGSADGSSLEHAGDLPLANRLRGRSPVDAQLLLSHKEQGECVLKVHSPLIGMAVALPEPLGKRPEERRELNASYWFTGPRADELQWTLGDRFAGALAVTGDPARRRAAVHFGATAPELPAEPGYVISGRLPSFDVGVWAKLLAEVKGSSRGEGVAAATPLPVRLNLDELGLLPLPENGTAGGSDSDFLTAPLPRLDVRIGELRYGPQRFGALSFHTENQPGRVLIRDLALSSPAFSLTGNARWQRGRRQRTEADLRFSGKDLGAAARELGVASVIDKGSFDLHGKLAWAAAPHQFGFEQLEGTLLVKLKDGTVKEVKPGAGRLLGLLSVHALPQRLTLDFRDMFGEGMQFRSVEGSFTFQDGSAFTDNLSMNALPAAIFVTGRTGLVNHDLDQTVTVVPDVSGTLPVAGGLMLGPQVGAALLLVQQLFHKTIDDTAKFKYTVTGSWESPVVTRVGKNS
jgi:uncharacterized protein (TIGR02099 family)